MANAIRQFFACIFSGKAAVNGSLREDFQRHLSGSDSTFAAPGPASIVIPANTDARPEEPASNHLVRRNQSLAAYSFCVYLGAAAGVFLFCAFPTRSPFDSAGQRILAVAPDICRVEADPSGVAKAVFSITNQSAKPVRIVGVESSCGCVGLPRLPVTIAANTDINLSFDVVAASSQDQTDTLYELRLFVDQPHPRVMLKIEVVPGADAIRSPRLYPVTDPLFAESE